ncbi:MAG: beta-lactamase family protein [Actinomycetota bacterium]|nr:beta-lactamase family protein [Actinomycetota bacterium]
MTEVHGEVATGYEQVRDAFQGNFDTHGDVGAAFSLYVRGEKVVDLWGGIADATSDRPWEEDTLQLVFSTTKGATAVCAHLLAQQGALDLDAPVAEYWPEFATEGKGDIPVRWLLSHRSGLPTVDAHLTPEQLVAWQPIIEALAAQKPYWEPGTAHGYHALTYGWLVGEVIKRVDGRSIGRFFADEVAKPLGLDFFIGLPETEEPRVSRLETIQVGGLPSELDVESLPENIRDLILAVADPEGLTQRALTVSRPTAMDFNSREVHAAEIPAANGITTARSLARMYAAVVGEVDGVRILDAETVADATVEQSNGPDKVLQIATRFGSGFFLPSTFSPLLGPAAFGHSGAGGSLGMADVDRQIGFGYVMNKMQQNLSGDPRTVSLVAAVNACVS